MTKDLLLGAMDLTGAFSMLRMLHRDKAVVAMYHRFGPGDAARTSPEVLAAQLEYLTTHYRVVPLSELAARLASSSAGGDRLAAVTIDDGYRDCYTDALPILQHFNVPAAVFLTTGFIDRQVWLWPDKIRYLLTKTAHAFCELRPNSGRRFQLTTPASRRQASAEINDILKGLADDQKDGIIGEMAEALEVVLPTLPPDEFAPLSWEEVAALEAAGLEIGAHTVTHPILTRVTPYRLRHEVWDARRRLEDELRHPVRLFCYPNGDQDVTVRREVKLAGYRAAVTAEEGLNDHRTNPFALRRIHTAPDLPRFVQSTCGLEEMKVALRRRFWRRDLPLAS